MFQINFQPHLHGLPAYFSPKALIPRPNIHLYSEKKMGLINMLFIVIALQVLFLMCMPAHEAIGEFSMQTTKNVMKNYEDKLFCAI